MDVETCRICANFYVIPSDVEFVNLFQPVQEDLQLEVVFIINEINNWQLNIAPNDGLPQRICANCFTKFSTINAFRHECETAQKILRKALEAEQSKCVESVIQNAQEVFTVQPNDSNGIIVTEVEPTIQEMVVTNEDVTKLQAEAILAPENIAINYNITYDENLPMNFVINSEGTVMVPSETPCVNGLDSNISVNPMEVNQINGSVETTTAESNFGDNNFGDLEEMLQGSIISKTQIKEDSKKQMNKARVEANSSSDLEVENNISAVEDDIIDDRPAQRIANFAFACNYCYCPPVGPIGHLIFKSSEALSQHFFDIHDPKSPYPCPKCPKLFQTNRRRNVHVSRVHDMASQRVIRCPYCRKVIRIPLEIHENNCTYLSDWRCNVCERNFRQMPLHSFRAHQRSHNSNPKFRCEICKRDFMRRSNLEAHKKVHESKAVASNDCKTCVECKKTFANDEELKNHEWLEHDGKAMFRCEFCYKGYSSSVFLNRHLSNMHSEMISESPEETTCSNCKFKFSTKLKLYYHQQRPKDENGRCVLYSPKKTRTRTHTCSHCMKSFISKDQLDRHLVIHDTRVRPHSCKKCSVRCRTVADLRKHISIAHLGTPAFDCDECSEQFAFKKDLENHKLYHSTLSFKCSLQKCNASFVTEEELSDHIRSIHEPIACGYCDEIYTRKELEVHQDLCLSKKVFGKVNDTAIAADNAFSNQHDVNKNQIEPSSSSTSNNNNVYVQFVNEQQQSIVLKDDLTTPTKTQQSVLDFLQSATDANIINAPDVPLNDDDYFISSLLDPDNEIVVT